MQADRVRSVKIATLRVGVARHQFRSVSTIKLAEVTLLTFPPEELFRPVNRKSTISCATSYSVVEMLSESISYSLEKEIV